MIYKIKDTWDIEERQEVEIGIEYNNRGDLLEVNIIQGKQEITLSREEALFLIDVIQRELRREREAEARDSKIARDNFYDSLPKALWEIAEALRRG